MIFSLPGCWWQVKFLFFCGSLLRTESKSLVVTGILGRVEHLFQVLIPQIPRLLGPGLNKAGKIGCDSFIWMISNGISSFFSSPISDGSNSLEHTFFHHGKPLGIRMDFFSTFPGWQVPYLGPTQWQPRDEGRGIDSDCVVSTSRPTGGSTQVTEVRSQVKFQLKKVGVTGWLGDSLRMCFKGFFTHFFLRGYFSGENNTFSLDKDPRQLRRCWILDFYKFLDSSNRRCDWDSWARAIFSCPGVVHGRCRGQRGHECRWVEVDIHSRVLHRRTPGPFAKCRQNCLMAINFLVSLLKKNWNNVKWGCPGNEASLWVSNILGFFCFFFCLLLLNSDEWIQIRNVEKGP